jgi:hypothetical protein
LISVHVQGRYAETRDTDPNTPFNAWVKTAGTWKVASFFVLG